MLKVTSFSFVKCVFHDLVASMPCFCDVETVPVRPMSLRKKRQMYVALEDRVTEKYFRLFVKN